MKIHISCLIDNDPKFIIQAYNWLLSLKATGTKATPFICAVNDSLSEEAYRTFKYLGAKVVSANRFGEGRAAYCNKISQLFIDDVIDCDFLILSDADIGFLAPPEQTVNGAPLRAKRVDLPVPHVTIIEEWLKTIGIPWIGESEAQFAFKQGHPWDHESLVKKQSHLNSLENVKRKTLAYNYNGGLYVIQQNEIKRLREAWSKYAAKLLAAAPLDAKWSIHADQVGLACAIYDLGIEVSELESCWNFPTHLQTEMYGTFNNYQELYGLHYHNRLDNHGLPLKVGVPWLDDPIELLRNVISKGRRECFDNEIFWNFRYKYFPELGSGIGSRTASLTCKKDLIAPALCEMTKFSVIDVGCGDLEFVRDFTFGKYLGLDLSLEAISIAQAKQPEWSFKHCKIETIDTASFDFSLCMDVLIHQPTLSDAETLVDNLLRVARKGVLLSIHTKKQIETNISFNTYAIKDYLRDHPDTHSVITIGTVRDITILAISKVESVFNDIQQQMVEVKKARRSKALKEVNRLCREFGFIDNGVLRLRQEVWSILIKKYNYKVAHGPFKGMSLPQRLSWGDDRITQTLGIYEKHVLSQLVENSQYGATKLIDIGAADGYFAIGLTFSQIYQKCIAFEVTQIGRDSILESAKRNQCENRIEIHGEANFETLTEALSGPEKSTVLIDIEGGEYDLLNDKVLEVLSYSFVICELHPFFIDDGLAREQDLLKRASKYFNTRLIKRETYNPNAFPELDHLNDDQRLVAVSESRRENMRWLVCTPV